MGDRGGDDSGRAWDRYPFIGIGVRETLRLTFARTSRLEPPERAAIAREGVVWIEEGVRTRVTQRAPGKIRINKPKLTLVLTRERLLLYTRWRRSVDVRLDDPDWSRVEISVDEEGRLRLVVPRGVGGGVHIGWELDVRLSVADAGGDLNTLRDPTGSWLVPMHSSQVLTKPGVVADIVCTNTLANALAHFLT